MADNFALIPGFLAAPPGAFRQNTRRGSPIVMYIGMDLSGKSSAQEAEFVVLNEEVLQLVEAGS